jgi:hypothetical protein
MQKITVNKYYVSTTILIANIINAISLEQLAISIQKLVTIQKDHEM